MAAMSDEKVVSLKVVPAGQGEVNADVVETLEELLGRARAGEVVGLAFVYAKPCNTVGTGWSRTTGLGSHLLASGVLTLMARMTRND